MRLNPFICALVVLILLLMATFNPLSDVSQASHFEPVHTAEEVSTTIKPVTYSSPDAPDIIAQFQYGGNIYHLIYDTLIPELPSDSWNCIGSLCSFVLHSSDFSADFQTNRDDYVNCQVYASSEDKGHLYLEFESKYHLFVLKELKYPWIYYNGALYLYEDIYYLNFDSSLANSNFGNLTFLPQDVLSLGPCATAPKYHFPSKELSSNDFSLFNKNIYYDADSDIIYVEIPNGVVNGQTRYDKYYPVPDNFCCDFR